MSHAETNASIETVKGEVAVISTRVDSVVQTVARLETKLDQLIANRPGFKDVWAPMGVGIIIITTVAGLAASGPLQHLRDVDAQEQHTVALVAAQAQDLSSARAERQALTSRVERLESIIDQRDQARFQADVLPLAKKPIVR